MKDNPSMEDIKEDKLKVVIHGWWNAYLLMSIPS
jgi:hypothetical protein